MRITDGIFGFNDLAGDISKFKYKCLKHSIYIGDNNTLDTLETIIEVYPEYSQQLSAIINDIKREFYPPEGFSREEFKEYFDVFGYTIIEDIIDSHFKDKFDCQSAYDYYLRFGGESTHNIIKSIRRDNIDTIVRRENPDMTDGPVKYDDLTPPNLSMLEVK